MFIRVQHETTYRYDRPVFIEPLTVRLTPRQDVTQRLLEHSLRVTPDPDGTTETLEPDGTSAKMLWFSDKHETLSLHVDSVVQTLRANPFDYLITDDVAHHLPVSYPPMLEPVLKPFLSRTLSSEIRDWSSSIAEAAHHDTPTFLSTLTARIYDTFSIVERPEGEPYAPEQTLSQTRGSCRDVAMLFVEACRAQGIAARFVSGYSTNHPPETTQHELHAWAEVYLPGGGWRGHDPSLGLAVAEGHIALATGPDHMLAAPVTGSFRGTGAKATMTYDITLRSSDDRESLGGTTSPDVAPTAVDDTPKQR